MNQRTHRVFLDLNLLSESSPVVKPTSQVSYTMSYRLTFRNSAMPTRKRIAIPMIIDTVE